MVGNMPNEGLLNRAWGKACDGICKVFGEEYIGCILWFGVERDGDISGDAKQLTARAGGIFLPIIKSLAEASDSLPNNDSARILGSYLVQSQLQVLSVIGLFQGEVDTMVSVMKVEKAPLESYADIGGLDAQIQEIKEGVELPLTHPELYEYIGIKLPEGGIHYGEPRAVKTLLA